MKSLAWETGAVFGSGRAVSTGSCPKYLPPCLSTTLSKLHPCLSTCLSSWLSPILFKKTFALCISYEKKPSLLYNAGASSFKTTEASVSIFHSGPNYLLVCDLRLPLVAPARKGDGTRDTGGALSCAGHRSHPWPWPALCRAPRWSGSRSRGGTSPPTSRCGAGTAAAPRPAHPPNVPAGGTATERFR